MPATPPEVFLHVGPPKTATTYLQDILWHNRSELARHDVDLPGTRMIEHFHAALDLRGMTMGGHENPRTRGAWPRLVRQVRKSSASKVIISHELFAGLRPPQIERVVADLAPSSLYVVYGARDLGRQLPAVWQESVKNRAKHSYGSYLRNALGERASRRRRRFFWRSQDAVEVLHRWSAVVPVDHINVVTLPKSGGPSDALWSRFCAAVGMDTQGFDLSVARPNASLSVADCMVLSRLNRELPDELDWPDYVRIVKRRFNQRANEKVPGPRLGVPTKYRDTVTHHTERIRAGLSEAGYQIFGDLDELIPDPEAFNDNHKVDKAAVADAAVELLMDVLVYPDRSHEPGTRGVKQRWSAGVDTVRAMTERVRGNY